LTPVITIDGPSGSGKGTIARRVATALGFHLLDSGALYRLVALAGSQQGVAADDQEGHARVARGLEVQFGMDGAGEERTIDYKTSLALFREAGFAGPITVEFEGLGNDLAGCLKTRDLVLRHW